MSINSDRIKGVGGSAQRRPGVNSAVVHRLRSLDAIRGIAAFLVVLSHSFDLALHAMSPESAIRPVVHAAFIEYLNLGRVGVVTFFMLSGYVIPFSFAHDKPIRSFLIARFFRLYPAYWVSMAGAVILAVALTGALPATGQILANLTMAQALLGQPHLIGAYWTLFYELLFYALCMFAFINRWMESPRYLLALVVGLMLFGLAAAVMRWAGIGNPPIGIPMFLGIMHLGTLARLSDRGDGPLARRCFAIAVAVVLLAVGPISAIGFIQRAAGERLIADVTSLYVGIAAFLLLRRNAAVCQPWLLFLGLISYSLYLFHPLTLEPLATLLVPMLPQSMRPAFILLSAPFTAILLATLMQRYVEAPGNRLGKEVRMRLRGGGD
jgi:peptidoglycan/LPS O-acetylase OafA/YrhL